LRRSSVGRDRLTRRPSLGSFFLDDIQLEVVALVSRLDSPSRHLDACDLDGHVVVREDQQLPVPHDISDDLANEPALRRHVRSILHRHATCRGTIASICSTGDSSGVMAGPTPSLSDRSQRVYATFLSRCTIRLTARRGATAETPNGSHEATRSSPIHS